MHPTVLITGASRGIGRAAAEYFITNGYSVIATCSHSPERLSDLQELAVKNHTLCSILTVDFSDENSINAFQKNMESLSFDCLINNAAISYVEVFQDMTPERWNKLIQVNLSSLYHTCRLAVPKFLSAGRGRILNISSVWGNVGASCEVAYSASKGGVNSFTKALAKELAPSHISVNAVAFGAVDTQMNQFLSSKEREELEEEIPYGRMLTTKEAAEIIFQISQLPPYVTGQIITADGGWT